MRVCVQLGRSCGQGHTALKFTQNCSRASVVSRRFSILRTGAQGNSVIPHVPVMLEEVLNAFDGLKIERFVDGTLGAGGHSAAILRSHPEIEAYIGLDVDPQAQNLGASRLQSLCEEMSHHARLSFHERNYSEAGPIIKDQFQGKGADAILLDLGVSSMQIDSAERGFSIRQDGPLDMRMGPSSYLNAGIIVNTWSEHDLGKIFREYGEERHWRTFASRIVDKREGGVINTTNELVKALGRVGSAKRGNDKKSIHPATRVFQALRIAVNTELEHLRKAIPACIENLAPGGRLAVISFHSLEDRIVKQAFLAASGSNSLTSKDPFMMLPEEKISSGSILTKKPLVPSQEEENLNPRSRSAKLRVFQRT